MHRRELGTDVGIVRVAVPKGGTSTLSVPDRVARFVDLELVLRTPKGEELRRSRIEKVPDSILDESFVEAIGSNERDDARLQAVSTLRLVWIVQMLQSDPILRDLLRQAASLPLDLRLLWRRVLRLVPDFEGGRQASDGSGLRFDLPFDLFLNDSLLIRLVATVMAPHGPTGAIGGIVALRAQDARHPERQMHVHLLGAARGPQSEWQREGVSLTTGYANEGQGLAFSPQGRVVVLPWTDEGFELRDLAGDAFVPHFVPCPGPTKDFAFLDDATLVVATEHELQVFDVTEVARPRLEASHAVKDLSICAVEAVDAATVFVGAHGFAIERWQFGAARHEAPQRERVHDIQREEWRGTVKAADGSEQPTTGSYVRIPASGWLRAKGVDRVLADDGKTATLWERTATAKWSKRAAPRAKRRHSAKRDSTSPRWRPRSPTRSARASQRESRSFAAPQSACTPGAADRCR